MLALLALTAVTLSACTPAPEPAPTPTAAFASEEEAFAAAEEVYRAYIDASNTVDYGDPSTFERLDPFTTGNYQSDEHKSLSEMHAEGSSRTGEIKILWFRGAQLNSAAEVIARTCNDISDTDVLNEHGESVVPDGRPSYYAIDLTFVVSGQQLLIATSQAIEDPECGTQ